jgi:hypothetical protein
VHPHHGSEALPPRTRTGTNRRDLLESSAVSGDWSDRAAAVRAEWRAEEQQWSRAALEQWEHGRALVDIARDAMHRGDTVTFAFPSIVWSGEIIAVGHDVARLDADFSRVDIRLAADAPFVLRIRSGPRAAGRTDATMSTFVVRLRERDGTDVSIGTAHGALEGTLRIGRDQLRLTDRDGGSAYVPIASAWWLRPLVD